MDMPVVVDSAICVIDPEESAPNLSLLSHHLPMSVCVCARMSCIANATTVGSRWGLMGVLT